MAARKYWLYLLPILALLWAPFVLVPRQTFANPDEYIVTSTDDTGGNCDATPTSCTLRQAINSANDDGVPSEILFSEALGSSVTISLSALLPPLTEPDTTITGLLNAGNAPRVRIDGGETLTYGLSVTATADDVAINKLIFTGFQGTGAEPNGVAIYVSGAEGTRIRGNYIGNLPGQNYASAQANNIGILIADASDVTIGGTEDTDRNTISGNVNDGVRVTNSSSITLNNNFVGVVTDFADAPLFRAKPLANGGSGIQLSDTDQSQIGANNLPNVISSNDLHGILITGSSSISNTVRHNYIGTDDTGSTYGSLDFGNGGDGVRIANDASNNALFGAGLGANRLVIAGNTDYGVLLTSGASNNSVATALIGLEVDGTTALANTSGGVAVQDDASANTIGPNNIIAGNGGPGVSLVAVVAGIHVGRYHHHPRQYDWPECQWHDGRTE
jgi:CSLREA domain-containing protein